MKKILPILIALLLTLLPSCAEEGKVVDPPRDYLEEISGEFTGDIENRIVYDNEVYTLEQYFELQEKGEPTPKYVYVSVEYKDNFICKCGTAAAGEELSHQDEIKQYYTTLNEKIIADLDLKGHFDISYSEYSPTIQYRFYLYDDFVDGNLASLKAKNPSYVSALRIVSAY